MNQKIRIKIDKKDDLRAFHTILTKMKHTVGCFPNEEYIIQNADIKILDKENIKYRILEKKKSPRRRRKTWNWW